MPAPYDLSFFTGTGASGAAAPGLATSSPLNVPIFIDTDAAGNLYIADTGNNRVEKVTPSGTLSYVAGTGSPGAPQAGTASLSPLRSPWGVAVDKSVANAGTIYIADTLNHRVEKIDTSGNLSVIAGTGTQGNPTFNTAPTASPLNRPAGSAVDSNSNVYFTDQNNSRILKLTPTGTMSVFAGNGSYGAPVAGSATSSPLKSATGLAIDAADNVYIGDIGNSMIEKVTPSGTLSVIAGTGTAGPSTPGPALSSMLNYPYQVDVDAAGNVYAADTYNGQIVKITPGGTLSVIAGTGTHAAATAGPATASTLNYPYGVAVDASGNVYVADSYNFRVEKLTPPSGSLPAITSSATVPGATVGSAYTTTATATGSPAVTWSVTAGALPAGVTLNASTGVLSGTPTAAGAATFTLRATNSAGYDEQAITLTTTNPPAPAGPTRQPQTVTITSPTTSTSSSGSSPAFLPLAAGTAHVKATASAGGALTYASSNAAVATIDTAGTLTLKTPGTTTVTVTAAATTTTTGTGTVSYGPATATIAVTVTPPTQTALPTGTTRLAGPDRIATSVAVSAQVFPDPDAGKSDNVVIATSAGFADSIAGARLAGQVDGPLLLTGTDSLDSAVAGQVRRLVKKGGTVYILGQTRALSATVKDALTSLSTDYPVQRLGGTDRYQTAAAIADEVTSRAGDVGPIYLVTGRDFADGVSVGAYAQRTGGVVLLSDGDTMPAVTARYLSDHDPDGTRLAPVGGAARSAAAAAGLDTSRAVVGLDRFDTSAKLAAKYTDLKTAANTTGTVTSVGIAGGASWPDALTGSAAMAHLDGPLLLTPTSATSLPTSTTTAVDTLAAGADRAVVFGGPTAVPNTIIDTLKAKIS